MVTEACIVEEHAEYVRTIGTYCKRCGRPNLPEGWQCNGHNVMLRPSMRGGFEYVSVRCEMGIKMGNGCNEWHGGATLTNKGWCVDCVSMEPWFHNVIDEEKPERFS